MSIITMNVLLQEVQKEQHHQEHFDVSALLYTK